MEATKPVPFEDPRRKSRRKKDIGYLGIQKVEKTLKNKKFGVATEYSVGTPIFGKETEYPTLVPTLTGKELKTMTGDVIPNKGKVPQEIMRKAANHARKRILEGKSPFYSSKER